MGEHGIEGDLAGAAIRRRFTVASRVSAAVVCLLGVSVLIGWAFDVPLLKSLSPTWVTMKVNTAAGFALTGLALCLLASRPIQRNPLAIVLARLCAAAVSAVGALTLCEYLIGCNLGIDQMFFREGAQAVATSSPGRMAPTTALNFLLLGVALLFLDAEPRRGRRAAQYLILPVIFIALLALLGRAFGAADVTGLGRYTLMAVHTAFGFGLAGSAALCARPGRGIMAVVTSSGPGGRLARRLLLAGFFIPFLSGWLRVVGYRAGLYSSETGTALRTIVIIVALSVIVWIVARAVDRWDAERRKAQEAFQQMAAIVESSSDAIIGKSLAGTILTWNAGAEKMYGYAAQEVKGRPISILVPPERIAEVTTFFERIRRGEEVEHFETLRIKKDGRQVQVSLALSAMKDAAGNIVGISTIARDITDRKKAEEEILRLNEALRSHSAQLEVANKELEAFSYSVSHDLRAPLRHVGGFVELLQKRCADGLDDKGKRYLDIIADSSREMGVLIDDLLSFSRMARAQMSKTTVPLAELTREVIQEMSQDTQGRDIEWDIAELPRVVADRAMLRLVLANLLGNAVKYTRTRDRAKIEVGCSRKEGEVVIFVRDNGVGFDMQYAHKLFGVFQRLHGSDEFEGTGIGLANVRRVVHRHGGRTWAEGAVDQGATFYFSLPEGKERAA